MSSVRCHYDVLGIPRDADATTIKKAYRKLALKYHPDKNIASSSSSSSTTDQNHPTLEQLFLQVQQAYECLSDIAERKWYDDHRDAILKGWSVGATGTSQNADAHHASSSASSADPNHDIVVNVAPYMYAGCYYGFDSDHPNSFYNVYQKVFAQIYQEEVHGCDRSHHHTEVEYLNVPFGNGTSSYDTVVVKFYQAWESFSSVLTYAWADQWNVQEAEQRRVRRAMEEDNGRSRRKARKIRNDEIAALVRFVKRRDPRIMAKKEEMEQLRLLREYELKELTKQRKLEKELANQTWREQAEQEALAMEEDDRINGRVRLADLQEDDYDYYGGKKKKRGKGKKALRGDDDHAEEHGIDPEPPQPPLDHDDPSIPISEMDQLNMTTEISVHVPCDDDDPASSLDVPLSQWRCECCVGQFQNEMEMMKHFKSKAHKDIAALRKSTTTTTKADHQAPAVDSLKKMKRKSKPIHHEGVMASSASLEPAIPNDDSHTEDDKNDDDDNDDDDDDVSNQNQVLDDDDDEPLYWRCECCQKDFQSVGQMENHMNSKKHKAMYRKYEKEVGKKLLYEVVEEMTNHPTTSTA